jgi:hypothetical protein
MNAVLRYATKIVTYRKTAINVRRNEIEYRSGHHTVGARA